MSWNLKIPKILHLYWGGNKPLSFFRYLTPLSFSKLNPDWEIRVYMPLTPIQGDKWKQGEQKASAYNGLDYSANLNKIKNLTVFKMDFYNLGIPKDLPEVHRSDIVRLYLLKEYGGVWSDFDVLYINPMDNFCYNTDPIRKDSDVFVCYNVLKGFHSIGFLMGCVEKNYSFFGDVFKKALLLKGSSDYQGYGRFLLESYFKYLPQEVIKFHASKGVKVANIPYGTVYAINWEQITRFYFGPKLDFFPDTLGIHWYAGSPISSTFDNKFNEGTIGEYESIPIYPYIKKALGNSEI